jgi:hypothetical protein
MPELKSIFLEPAFYFQNFASWVPVTHENGEFVFNLPLEEQTKLHCMDVTQLGEAVSRILKTPEAFVSQVVPIWGDALTGVQIEIDCID